MNTTEHTIEHDIIRLADLQAIVAEATSEMDSIKRRIREHYAASPGTHEVAGRKVSVAPALRFSEDQARDVLPEDIVTLATVSKLDSAAVKRMVAPEVYALCCTATEARVSLR